MDLERSAGTFAGDVVAERDEAKTKDLQCPSLGERSVDHGEDELLGTEMDEILAAKMVIINDVSTPKSWLH